MATKTRKFTIPTELAPSTTDRRGTYTLRNSARFISSDRVHQKAVSSNKPQADIPTRKNTRYGIPFWDGMLRTPPNTNAREAVSITGFSQSQIQPSHVRM